MPKYEINAWGSHPDLGNDDCLFGYTGTDAVEAARTLEKASQDRDTAYIEFTIDDNRVVGKNQNYKPAPDEPDNEFAMQQGMAFGVDAWNEARGS